MGTAKQLQRKIALAIYDRPKLCKRANELFCSLKEVEKILDGCTTKAPRKHRLR